MKGWNREYFCHNDLERKGLGAEPYTKECLPPKPKNPKQVFKCVSVSNEFCEPERGQILIQHKI